MRPKPQSRYFSNPGYGGKNVPSRPAGWYVDAEGVLWQAFVPSGNDMSAWVRLESPGRRAKMVYDAGGGFKAARLLARKPRDPKSTGAKNYGKWLDEARAKPETEEED
jgi:hypothetical protein